MGVITAATAVVSAVAAGFSAAGAGLTFSWAAAGIAFGSSLALSFAGKLLAPKAPSLSSYGDGDFTRQFRQPTSERRLVYGEVRTSGAMAFIGSTDNNKYLHMVVTLATHEIEEIGEIIINEESIPLDYLDGDGTVNNGKFQNLIRIKKHLGTTDQVADSDLVSEVDDWTEDHRLQGIAYIYVRFKYDRNEFKSGIPNVSAYVRGKKLYDTRTSTTAYSSNIALMMRDYLIDQEYGFEVSSDNIDDVAFQDSANNCDEMQVVNERSFLVEEWNNSSDTVTLVGEQLFLQRGDKINISGSGLPSELDTITEYYVIPYQRAKKPRIRLASTLNNAVSGVHISFSSADSGVQNIIKKAEPRYYGGGIVKTDVEIGNNLKDDIASGMGGVAIRSGVKWRILSGQYYEPVYYFNESHVVSQISVTTKKSKKDRFNRIKGEYTSPINNGNPSDYPFVENSLYQTQDGEVITRDLSLPFCQRPSTAQRIAKIELERQRQEIIVSASFRLDAFKVQAGDNLYFSFDRYGWVNKVFEVIEWSIGVIDQEGVPVPVINMTLQENASEVYDWNNGEETLVDPSPNTILPNPFTVPVVAGFSLDSRLIDTQNGDKIYQVLASWTYDLDEYVTQGGFFEIEYKRTTESVYQSAGKVDGDINEMFLNVLQPNVFYDIRIRVFNNFLASSNYSTINNFQVGSTATTDTEDWENNTELRDGDDFENDTLTSEDWET